MKVLDLNGHLESIRSLMEHLRNEIENLEAQVLTDDLTGLLRRNAFFERARKLITEAARGEENLGVMMVDLDHFKKINDLQGHAGGDEVLRRVSKFLKQFDAAASAVGRYGGEEFIVAMLGSEREVEAKAEMIRRGVESLGCTVSIGVAHTNQKGFLEENLIEAADQALYSAKHSGRNQVKRAA